MYCEEVPSNWILEKYFPQRPSIYIGTITVLWGIMMTLHGVVKDFGGIVSVRFVMGIFEAGFFPGAVSVSKIIIYLTSPRADHHHRCSTSGTPSMS